MRLIDVDDFTSSFKVCWTIKLSIATGSSQLISLQLHAVVMAKWPPVDQPMTTPFLSRLESLYLVPLSAGLHS